MDGNYSMKTAYMLGKGCNLENFHKAWVEIWNLEVTPKVRHFLWRVCTGTLPTRAYLHYRHMIDISDCPWCSGCPETTSHVLFDFPTVRDLWVECDCIKMSIWPTGMSFLDLVVSWAKLDKKKICRGAILLWNIWHRRNELIFNGEEIYHPLISDRVFRLADDCMSYMKRIYGGAKKRVCSSPMIWKAPPDGTFKINCDASLSDHGWVGLGVIARNCEGEVLFAATRRIRVHWPPIIAKVKAAALAIKLAKRFSLSNIIIESDSEILINQLCKGAIFFSDLDSLEKIQVDILY